MAGTLDVKQANGYLPEIGDEVVVLFSSADSMGGAFTSTTGLTSDDLYDLEVGQTTTQLTLKVIVKP